ncbi:metalloregulator ArsR/SmtB family transcription factor [bacterium]|nr:metalloregulator ArsR/SmtB family transcription factor [bacterium]
MKKLKHNKFLSLFKLLSDPNRLGLVYELCKCPEANVGQLSKCCSIDFSVVSRHLTKLKLAGVLRAKKRGKEVYYDLNKDELAKLLREFADEIESSSCCN